MNIAGLQKTSVIDFPGNICSTIFVSGCNLRCRYCYNRDLVLNSTSLSFYLQEEVLNFFQQRKSLLDGVCISGGEPTLQEDLPQFVYEIKKIGLQVKLDSNGTFPQVIYHLLEKALVDYIAVDIKAPLDKYSDITSQDLSPGLILSLKETIELLINSTSIDYEFRTTVIPGIIHIEDITAIARQIKGAEKYVLQQFQPYSQLMDPLLLEHKPYTKETIQSVLGTCLYYVNNIALRGFTG